MRATQSYGYAIRDWTNRIISNDKIILFVRDFRDGTLIGHRDS